jgi:hypothetical protein
VVVDSREADDLDMDETLFVNGTGVVEGGRRWRRLDTALRGSCGRSRQGKQTRFSQ